MKKKLCLLFLFVIFLMILSSGCKKNTENNQKITPSPLASTDPSIIYESITKELVNLKSFACSADVQYINNDSTKTYATLQYGNANGEYRIEVTSPQSVAGSVTVYDGKEICKYNSKLSKDISKTSIDESQRSELFLTSFMKNYANSDEVSVSVSDFGKAKCTILEAIIPGSHPYLATEKLWIDNTTDLPSKLVIYDYDNKERIIVSYNKFTFNPILNKNVFSANVKK